MPRKIVKDPDGQVFGGSVRRLRGLRGWTQEELADRAGLSATYLGFIERGENVPTLPVILRLADAFETTAGSLLDDVQRQQRRR